MATTTTTTAPATASTSPAQPKPKINHLGLIPTFLDIYFATTIRAITSPFVAKKHGGGRTYRRDVMYAMLREILSGFSVHEGQYLQRNTEKVYKSVAKSRKWKANSVDLEFGAKGHWLGESDAEFVMVYFHGGGYISPATPGHLKYQFALQKYLRKQGISVSILSLSYVLAPHAIYPVQLQSALSSLKYLINTMKRDPSTILLGGDSAGGNLVAELMLHLGHPHPNIEPFPLARKLKGALLISPWVSFSTTETSFKSNAESDYLTIEALNRASHAFVGEDVGHDAYSEPVNAPIEWWRDVADRAVDDVLIWGGGGEVLIDGITKFAEHLVQGFEGSEGTPRSEIEHGDVEKNIAAAAAGGSEKILPVSKSRAQLIVSPKEAHEEMIIDYVLFIRREEDGGRQIKKWLLDLLRSAPPHTNVDDAPLSEKKEGFADDPVESTNEKKTTAGTAAAASVVDGADVRDENHTAGERHVQSGVDAETDREQHMEMTQGQQQTIKAVPQTDDDGKHIHEEKSGEQFEDAREIVKS